ncbi:MAG: shikimate dehydrogenase [Tannerella sp.]|jgi:shikimate dehydrogenase|nr:shikimate dehydrogenase [Tannerella sp.]
MKKLYGLIGYPLGHSFSKDFFNRKFKSENIDAEYRNFQIANVDELKNVLCENPSLCGLNVTLPYKTQVIGILDEIDDDARQIGAVNVIRFMKGRFGRLKLKGYNSDIIGFKQSIEPLLNDTHRNALILGTGGASKAVFHGLRQLNINPTLVSRTARDFCITYQEVTSQLLERYTVIVNTTPVGMYPKVEECPDIPYDSLTSDHLLYDLLYNPDEPTFLQRGKERGCTVKNGLEMLLLQAFESWRIWNES